MTHEERARCLLRSLGRDEGDPMFQTDVLAVSTQFGIVAAIAQCERCENALGDPMGLYCLAWWRASEDAAPAFRTSRTPLQRRRTMSEKKTRSGLARAVADISDQFAMACCVADRLEREAKSAASERDRLKINLKLAIQELEHWAPSELPGEESRK